MIRYSLVAILVLSLVAGFQSWRVRNVERDLKTAQEAVGTLQMALAAERTVALAHSKVVAKIQLNKGKADAEVSKALALEPAWSAQPVPPAVAAALGL